MLVHGEGDFRLEYTSVDHKDAWTECANGKSHVFVESIEDSVSRSFESVRDGAERD